MIASPSLVPNILSDEQMAIALEAMLQLLDFDVELGKWFVTDDRLTIFSNVPGLLDHLQQCARWRNSSKAHSKNRKGRTLKNQKRFRVRDSEMASEFEQRRYMRDAAGDKKPSDSCLKAAVGAEFNLERTHSIEVINKELKRRAALSGHGR